MRRMRFRPYKTARCASSVICRTSAGCLQKLPGNQLKNECPLKSAGSPLQLSLARRQLEISNSRVPVDRASGLAYGVILVYIPERAIIHRVHRHAGVIAPMAGILFVSGAIADQDFGRLGFARQTPVGCANAGMTRSARGAVTGGSVARFILRDAGHEAEDRAAIGNRAALI